MLADIDLAFVGGLSQIDSVFQEVIESALGKDIAADRSAGRRDPRLTGHPFPLQRLLQSADTPEL
jgi:hypothetical protein